MADTVNATDPTRRDFLYIATGAAAAVGGAATLWPFIDQMNPDASTLALSSIEVNIASIQPGQIVTVLWRGKPVFIRHRTPEEIKAAQDVKLDELPDPQEDKARVQKPEWLILVGICTHLGCVPIGPKGDYQGWLCPCHGSQYNSSGRVRVGPAPANLAVPDYKFISDTVVQIG